MHSWLLKLRMLTMNIDSEQETTFQQCVAHLEGIKMTLSCTLGLQCADEFTSLISRPCKRREMFLFSHTWPGNEADAFNKLSLKAFFLSLLVATR